MLLSLDISTRCVGYCFMDDKAKIYHHGAITIPNKPEMDLFDKLDFFLEKFTEVLRLKKINVTMWYVEEPVKRFSIGKSKASTIITLHNFNFAICSRLYDLFKIKPIFLNVNTVRAF